MKETNLRFQLVLSPPCPLRMQMRMLEPEDADTDANADVNADSRQQMAAVAVLWPWPMTSICRLPFGLCFCVFSAKCDRGGIGIGIAIGLEMAIGGYGRDIAVMVDAGCKGPGNNQKGPHAKEHRYPWRWGMHRCHRFWALTALTMQLSGGVAGRPGNKVS